MTPEKIVFLLAAFITLISAGFVVSTRKILHASLWLVVALLGVAMVFALLQASFFAVVQVLVYIGAIAILVIFAVMLTRRVMQDVGPQVNRVWPLAALVCVLLFGSLVWLLSGWRGFQTIAPDLQSDSTIVTQLGQALVSPNAYMVPFEAASVLLLAALVGAIYVAWPKK
jgi:NADH:ubiquinone oxidoreductase subunit 6 (chain J)